jgi:hypothetical protein
MRDHSGRSSAIALAVSRRYHRSLSSSSVAVVVLLLFLPPLVRDASAAELFPYRSGGETLERGDEETVTVSLATSFPFLGQNYSQATVHSDGFISLQLTTDSAQPTGGSSSGSAQIPASSSGSGATPTGVGSGVSGSGVQDSAKENITALYSSSGPVVGVFLTDVDTSGMGDVYYRLVTNDSVLFQNVTQSVQTFFSASFSPSQLLLVTWSDVGYYNNRTDMTNTFQAVLATDGSESYSFLLYSTLEWTGADSNSSAASEDLPQVGFTDGDSSFSVLPGTNATDGLNFSYHYLDSDQHVPSGAGH